MALICQGAEGRIMKGHFLGRSAIFKERFIKKYRHPHLDEALGKERLRSEARLLNKCRTIGLRVPAVYFVDIANRCLVLEHVDDSVPVRVHVAKLQSFGEELALVKMVRDVGRTIAIMHQNHVIHGDLTTSNMLVQNNEEIVLIDFGLSYIEASAEDKGVDLYVLERAFLSTHPNTQVLFDHMLNEYCKTNKKESDAIMKKLDDVRLRGRKRDMVG